MKRVSLLLVFALFVAACGGSTGVEPSDGVISNAPSATEAPSDDGGSSGSTETTAGTTAGTTDDTEAPAEGTVATRQRPEGPDAPDFELALGQGGVFTLSGEAKPVYMVFWAEW